MLNYKPYCWVMCSLNGELLGNFEFLGFETPYENKQDTQQTRQAVYYNVTLRRVHATNVALGKP